MAIKNYFKKFNIGILLDILLFIALFIQDIDCLRIFNTQAYKYVLILMLFILIYDFIKNKKTFKINIFYILILLLMYAYLYALSFCKTIIIPSVYFVIEAVTFAFYIQSKESIEKLISSITKILLYNSVIIGIFSLIQFVSFQFDFKSIYEFLTQYQFYLYEGRFSSIYTEPAHLCTIICAGVFLSMYNIFTGKRSINYFYLILLLFASVISGSIIVYISLFLFILLAYFIAIFNKKKEVKIIKKNVVIVTILSIIAISLSFTFFEKKVVYSAYNKLNSLLSKETYNIEDENQTKNLDENINTQFDLEDISNNTELQNEIMYEQLSNASAYAIKSNLYIGIDKFKDKYYLGTGMFTHIVYYDKYMEQRYPNGYVRINYGDAGSIYLRVLSEFGIIGLIIFIGMLLYWLIKGIIKQDYFLLFILVVFVTQSLRLGEYNWVLNCLGFVILLGYIKFPKKWYLTLNKKSEEKLTKVDDKRILALTGVFLPHNETVTQISYKMLCNLDYEIDVVAFRASIDDSFEKLLKKDPKFKKFHIHYIDVDWKDLDISSHNFNIFKIKKYIKMYNKKSMELFEKNHYEKMFSFSVPNYTHYAAYRIKQKCNSVEWFASFSDPIKNNLYIEELKNGKFKTKILYFLLKLVSFKDIYQDCALKYSDHLIFISNALKNHYINGNKEYDKKSIIYPITYVKEWPNYKLLTSKTKQKKNDKIIMSHFGNIYGLRKIDKFLQAISELINEHKIDPSKLEIHQYGEVDKEQIKLFNTNKFKDILFVHDRVDYDKCVELMKKSDVLLIFDTIIEKGKIQPFLPSKITDYLLTSKPIFSITNVYSPLYEIVNKKHICTQYDVNQIKEGLIRQLSDIKNINNDIKEYDNDYVSKKVFKNLLDLI